MENYFITENKSWVGFKDGHGYNLTLGGDGALGRKMTAQQRLDVSKRNKGQKSHNK